MNFMNNNTNPIIIGIDHGYGNIKTAHCCFKTGVAAYDKEPTFKSNLLVYEGRYYLIGEEHKEFYQLCKKLIDDYENIDSIDYDRVLKWGHKKIVKSIDEYTVIYVDDRKADYYHFYKNEDGENEIDDQYIFSEYQNQGIGSEIIKKCCKLIDEPVMLYVFIKNQRAVSLYKRLGFEKGKQQHIQSRRNLSRGFSAK